MQKCRSYATVKTIQNKIPIKRERDVQLQLNIKTEYRVSNHPTQNDSILHRNSLPKDQHTFVEKIVALKSENNKNLLALKKSQAEHAALLVLNQNLEQKFIDTKEKFETELKNLQSELSVTKNDLAASITSSDKIIAALKSELVDAKNKLSVIVADYKKEIKTLHGRIKQYQCGLDQRENKMEQSAGAEYEVEAIIDNRETAIGKQYLIRWKGFDEDEDSWESEKNLNCPKILNAYIRSTRMKRK